MIKSNTRPRRSPSSPASLGARIRSALGPALSLMGDRFGQASFDAQTQHHLPLNDSLAQTDGFPHKSQGLNASMQAALGVRQNDITNEKGLKAYMPLASVQRSVSAPEMSRHMGSLLGPVCGVATTKTTKQILDRLLQAQTAISAGNPAEQIAARFDLTNAKKALLRRDTRQTGDIEDLASTPIERVFESLLAEELMKQMPAKLLLPMQQLAQWMGGAIGDLSEERAQRVIEGMLADLRKEHPRPWSSQQPLLARLCEKDEPWQQKWAAVTAYLHSDLAQGIDGLTSMLLLRSSFLGYKSAGLDTTLAPWLKDADRSYQANILPRKSGGFSLTAPAPAFNDKIVGITNLGQPSPLNTANLVAGVRATYRANINLGSEDARESIAFANPVAAGLSGTTNMFLHAASHYNETSPSATKIDGSALTTLLAALTCYDGGHSIHEVFAIGHLLSNLPQLGMDVFSGYVSGHARGIFVDLAAQYGAHQLTDVVFDRLDKHFRANPMP